MHDTGMHGPSVGSRLLARRQVLAPPPPTSPPTAAPKPNPTSAPPASAPAAPTPAATAANVHGIAFTRAEKLYYDETWLA
jgi:hypothetical protein